MNQNVASYPSVLGVPDCIEERVNFDASLAQVVGSSARWSSFESRYQSGVVTGSAFLTRPLPRYVSRVRNDRIYTATLVQATPSAPLAGRATISYRYLISENRDWRTLFPNLDFLMCPILQGIRDADLDQGREIENIAGTFPVTLTSSSRYLYPGRRLVHVDESGNMVMKVEGVERYERLWSTYPYNMWGAVGYPSNGHYCVTMVYEQDPHRLWENTYNSSGVELQQNNQNRNATGMYHFKNGGRTSNYYGVNTDTPRGSIPTLGIYILIYNIDISPDEQAKTYVYIKNVTTGVVYVDTTRIKAGDPITPPATINVYWRSYANGYGRVKWFGVMRGTQDDATIEVLKHYLTSFASS